MDRPLSRLEARLQRFIEEGTARLFSSKDLKLAFAARLAEKMQAEVQFTDQGQLVAPHKYIIEVNEADAPELNANEGLINDLQEALNSAAQQADVFLPAAPALQFQASKNIPAGDFRVRSSIPTETLSNTQSVDLSEEPKGNRIPFGAFLIVNGANIFPLAETIINIGRKNDNHLVLDNPHVSRRHAQLRAIAGTFHFFDLGSTGGSTINGQKVKRAALLAGDVISIAGVPLIYGQDSSTAEAATQELDTGATSGSETPTADLNPAE